MLSCYKDSSAVTISNLDVCLKIYCVGSPILRELGLKSPHKVLEFDVEAGERTLFLLKMLCLRPKITLMMSFVSPHDIIKVIFSHKVASRATEDNIQGFSGPREQWSRLV